MGFKKFIAYMMAPALALGLIATTGCSQESKIASRIKMGEDTKNNTPDKYAVLINGGTETRFSKNLGSVYQTLVSNKFERDNIYVLDNSSGLGDYPVDDSATKDNLKLLFSYLAKKVDEEDLFLVHLDDHGERGIVINPDSHLPEGITYVNLPGGNLDEKEFAGLLSQIDPKVGIVTADICYGGGIAHRVGTGKFIGISAASETEVAFGSLEPGGFPSFCHIFYQAFTKEKSRVYDLNGDGKVTIEEAFEYSRDARKNFAHIQTPQLVIDPNPLVEKPDPNKISLSEYGH